MNTLRVLIVTCAIFLGITSCADGDKSQSDARPYIVATTGMVADLVSNIAGDSLRVEAIMQPGVDPHLYKASQGDLEKIIKADYLFFNGLHLEGKMAEILEKQHQVKPVVAVADSIPKSKIIQLTGSTYDPHIWFDVSLWRDASTVVLRNLVRLDPENAAYYEQNAARYQAELDSLDQWVKRELESVAPSKRVLITAHDAFAYFGRAYNIEVRGLQGISTLSEIGLRDVTNLVNFIVEKDIPAVFVETSVSDKSLKAVLEGVNGKGKKLSIGGSLFSDAMGPAGTPQGTYTGMVKHNVKTIANALKQ